MHVSSPDLVLQPSPRWITHPHARGLRRDLFRLIQDQNLQWQSLAQRVQAAIHIASPREGAAILRRLRPCLLSTLASAQHVRGPEAESVRGIACEVDRLVYQDDGNEDMLFVSHVTVPLGRLGGKFRHAMCGGVSQHAVERIFQRMGTCRLDEVQSELAGAWTWMESLHQAVLGITPRRRPSQIVVPSATGAFLGQCCPDSALLNLRTWVPFEADSRVGRTITSLHAWGATPASDRVATFKATLAQPCNRWLRDTTSFHTY